MSARRREERAERAAAGGPAPLAWIETLEARVHDAVERLAAAKAENAELRRRVAALEARLAAGDGGEAPAGGDAGRDDAEREAWRREREEVRQRVARLAESLEALLAES